MGKGEKNDIAFDFVPATSVQIAFQQQMFNICASSQYNIATHSDK